MYGLGLIKGLGITLRHFFDSYTEDLRWLGNKYTTPTFNVRQGAEARGIFTVEYPDEKLAMPEHFRFVPFLVVNNYDDPYAPGDDWCTSCGICAKVCPPQCIWIVRGTDPETGRPKPQPEAFYIDIDICMNCGYCAEYCPFDAIKMDHDYELASYDRTSHHIYDKEKLSKEFRYWQTIAPSRIWDEAEARGHWEHKDVEKLAKKAGVTLPPPTEENMYRATTVLPEAAAPAPAARPAAASPAIAAPAATRPAAAASGIWEAKVLENKGKAKEIKLTGDDRKRISAAKKAVQEAGLDWETITEASVSGVAAPEAPAAPPAAQATSIENATPVSSAAPAAPAAAGLGAGIWQAKQLEIQGKNKEIKLTGEHRKQISAAKKAVQEAGLDWDSITESSVSSVAGSADVAPTPVAQVTPDLPPSEEIVVKPVAAVAPGGAGESELRVMRELERKGQAKEIKLSGEDRKRIANAKKLAKDTGVDWDSL